MIQAYQFKFFHETFPRTPYFANNGRLIIIQSNYNQAFGHLI